ncbi:alpha/beta fold hydrolase [Halorientalis salina]|uniref:alpha/beta fold hydrolase n=1 Tax=Halorientalis salina TaxID=2932266 RepID=UPI0010AB58B0|nr:alpha/beta fold hydrolase [Halorientalis salina]
MRTVVVSNGKRAIVWLLAVMVVVATLGVGWAANPHQPRSGSVAAATDDANVTVEERRGSYVISQTGDEPASVGLVFYPGGHVDPEAYVPVLAPYAAETGVRVYVPKMPFTLSVLDPDRAGVFREQAPEIRTWYVGGHSLGGSMACQYASNNPERVDGVVLAGSYCEQSINGTDLSALQVLGSRDGVVTSAESTATDRNLPENATVITLEGVNHTQFGSYTGQADDLPANVSYEVAHERIRRVLWAWSAARSDDIDAPENGTLAPESEDDSSGLSGLE